MTDPMLAKARHHRELSGLSEARVYLMSEDGATWFVRKAASSVDASARLERQARKQEMFATRIAEVVATPAIVGEGVVDDRYYFDMEFVAGTDGASFLRQASIPAVREFTERLCTYLAAAAECESAESVDLFGILYERIASVQQRTGAMSENLLGRLFGLLEPVREIGPLTATLCHGDLTFENMVVDRQGKIWVLDLLDSPIEHYWQDVAKLHQDLAGGWYLRRVSPIARSVLGYVSSAVLETTIARQPAYGEAHLALLVSSFIRILPYAREEDDRQMILDRVEHFASARSDPDKRTP